MGAHACPRWGSGVGVESCPALLRQSPIPVAIYITSVIPCLLLALCLRKEAEVTGFFVPHPSSAGFTLVALAASVGTAAPSAAFHPALVPLRRARLLEFWVFSFKFQEHHFSA